MWVTPSFFKHSSKICAPDSCISLHSSTLAVHPNPKKPLIPKGREALLTRYHPRYRHALTQCARRLPKGILPITQGALSGANRKAYCVPYGTVQRFCSEGSFSTPLHRLAPPGDSLKRELRAYWPRHRIAYSIVNLNYWQVASSLPPGSKVCQALPKIFSRTPPPKRRAALAPTASCVTPCPLGRTPLPPHG